VARDYPAFLRGERTGEEILFSPARLKLWIEFFSNDNGLYAVNNRVGAVAAAGWLRPGPLRILELGGGLGSAAIALLERLRDVGRWNDVVEYRFTDVVSAFLRRGAQALERRYADAPFVRVASLDMNRPFAEQGVEPGAYSLVYAVNTLHVARDLGTTLREVRSALSPEGILVISECVRLLPGQTVYAEFVFALLESFRAPVLHPAYRPNGGFLMPEQWRAALAAAGFTETRLLPDVQAIREAFPNFYVMAVGASR
jgi:SAM-dependent methyltransferase